MVQTIVFHDWFPYLERTGSEGGGSGPLLLSEADLTCPLIGLGVSPTTTSELLALKNSRIQEFIENLKDLS